MQMFDEDVILILGGGSGLGLGIARHFVSEGAQVAIFEISQEKLDALGEEFGDQVLLFRGDVTSLEDLEACRTAIVERYGRLDALVGSQGVFDGNVPLKQIDAERVSSLFDELFRINVLGYLLSVKVFMELLEVSRGSVVLTASVAAYAADGGGLMYTSTKGAVLSAVKQLAFELAPFVRVNGVAPGAIADSQLRGPAALGMDGFKQSDIPKELMVEGFRRLTLMPELPTPADYAPVYAFLASRHNAVTTGQTILLEQGGLNRAMLSASAAGGEAR